MNYEQMCRMVGKARARHEEITFCGEEKSWPACFTVENGTIVLWYNDSLGGTHVITEPYELPEPELTTKEWLSYQNEQERR